MKSRAIASGVLVILIGVAVSSHATVPKHWMSHPNLAHVTVDGKSSSAVIFKGNPTDFDNEIFFLVEVQGSGTFLIDVEGEKYRLTAANEYVHLPGGVWLKHPMTDGKFVEPKWSKGTMALVDSNGRSIEVNP